MEPVLAAPWAKLEAGSSAYHPVICHLIDVAAVAAVLWSSCLAPGLRGSISAALRLDEAATQKLIGLVAGLHDLGKLSPEFQLRDPAARVRLAEAGVTFNAAPAYAPHGVITAGTLPDLLVTEAGLDRASARRLADIVGAHHGTFAKSSELQVLSKAHVGGPIWHEVRRAHVRALLRVFDATPPLKGVELKPPASLALAGLVSVADWIGSMSERFPYAAPTGCEAIDLDLVAYASNAIERAEHVLGDLGWTGWTPVTVQTPFADLFGFAPRPLQQALIDVASSFEGPSLLMVEAPMGEGKTEAALYLADIAESRLGRRGAYVALPTQATSNQMLRRVREFLARRHPDERLVLELLHGQAALSAEVELMRRLGRVKAVCGVEGPEQQKAGVIAGEWFSQRKRGLLAPFGVGTVDQGLLAVLQTRHVFVRLFGLAGKTVIIDEVHAYDVYMSSLLERLLEWLGALGTSVALLSATLPNARRDALAAAYARGAGIKELPPQSAYPCLSWVGPGLAGSQTVATSAQAARTLELKWLDAETGMPEALAERVAERLSAGGCLAVICNTVARAQDVFEAIERRLRGNADDGLPQVDLLHSRFLFDERQTREERTLARFGKEGPGRPARAVLVATQVIEQSLDLDFDFMISDFAPVDLLLQRSGRLHRHERRDRAGGESPVLEVVGPHVDKGFPEFGAGTRAVYDEHVLLRTFLVLRDRAQIAIPGDVQALIEAVYDNREIPAALAQPLADMWRRTATQRDQVLEAERAEAVDRWIGRPSFDGPLYQLVRGELAEDAPDFHVAHQALTRLTGPEASIVFLEERNGVAVLPDGTVVDPDAEPNLSLARRLLQRSVRLASRRVVHTILAEQPPAGWKRSSLLAHHRLLRFGTDGRCRLDRWTIHLHPQKGLVIEESEVTDACEL